MSSMSSFPQPSQLDCEKEQLQCRRSLNQANWTEKEQLQAFISWSSVFNIRSLFSAGRTLGGAEANF